jgi:hypothetical protein
LLGSAFPWREIDRLVNAPILCFIKPVEKNWEGVERISKINTQIKDLCQICKIQGTEIWIQGKRVSLQDNN